VIKNHFYRMTAISAMKQREQHVDDVHFLIVAVRDQLLRHLSDDHSMCFGRCGRTGGDLGAIFSSAEPCHYIIQSARAADLQVDLMLRPYAQVRRWIRKARDSMCCAASSTS